MKTLLRFSALATLLIIFTSSVGWGQSLGDYRTKATGNWTEYSTVWETYNGSSWVAATEYPDYTDGAINVQNNISVNANVTIDQLTVNATLTVLSSYTMTVNFGGSLSNYDLIIEATGILKNQGSVSLSSNATIQCKASGKYQHDISGAAGTIPNTTWDVGSTCEILNCNTAPSGLNQSYSNFTWNCSGQSGDINLNGNLRTVNGNFSLDNTNSNWLILVGSASLPLYIGTDFKINGSTPSNPKLNFTNSTSTEYTNTLTINGSYLQTGGTFTNNAGSGSRLSLYIGGNASTFEKTSNTNSTYTGNKIDWYVNGTALLTLKSNLSLSIDGTFTIYANGTLDCGLFMISGNIFTLNSYGKLITAHLTGITVAGASGSIRTTTRNYNNDCNLEFNGSSAQTASGVPASVYNLIINNASGVTFSNHVIVKNILDLNRGNLTNTGYKITLGYSWMDEETFEVFYEPGTFFRRNDNLIVGASFERYLTASTGSYAFPVTNSGSTTDHTAIVEFTTAPSNGGSITVSYTGSDPGNNNNPSPVPDGSYSVNTYLKLGYWTINKDADLAGGNYKLDLNAFGMPAGYVSAANYTKLRILKRANSSNNWSVDGAHFDAGGNNTNPIAKRTGLSGFSEFTIGGNYADGNNLDGPLPVVLNSFTYSVKDNNAKLIWTTNEEINNSGFDIERAGVDGQFAKIGFIKGNGNSNSPITYNYTDSKLNAGKYKYRLKQIDYNGNFEYFTLEGNVEVGVPNKFEMSQNYPNPFNPVTKIDFEVPENGMVSIKIYDMLGKEVKTLVNEMKQAGYHTVELNAGNISSGTYFYRMTAGKFVKTLKMVVVK